MPKRNPDLDLAEPINLARERQLRRPTVGDRQDLVRALVEQLAGLLRGQTSALEAAQVRLAASRALDLLDGAERGETAPQEVQQACRRVEELLRLQRRRLNG